MPSKYNNTAVGIYRSKKESRFAELLAEHGIPFEYESIKYELVPKFSLMHYGRYGKKFKQLESIRPITYTPDFFITTPINHYVVEIKGFRTTGYNLKKKLFLYTLYKDKSNSIFVELNSISEMKTFLLTIKNEFNYDRVIKEKNTRIE